VMTGGRDSYPILAAHRSECGTRQFMDSSSICITPNPSLSSFPLRRKPLPRVSSPHLWSSTITLPRLYTHSCLFVLYAINHPPSFPLPFHSASINTLHRQLHFRYSSFYSIFYSSFYPIFFSLFALTDHSATSCVSFIYFLVPVAIKHNILPPRKGILLHLHIIAFISSLYASPLNTPIYNRPSVPYRLQSLKGFPHLHLSAHHVVPIININS